MFNQHYERAVAILAVGGVILSVLLVFASSVYF